jgi:hypothetical protein
MRHHLLLPEFALLGACSITSNLRTSGLRGSSTGGSSGPASGGPAASTSADFTMPNLFRMKKDDAVKALERAGFRGSITWDDQLCSSVIDGQIVERGEVCRQHPPAGRTQSAKLPAKLLVQPEDPRHGNLGHPTLEWHLMPDVIGMSVEQALAAVKAAGLTDVLTRVSQVEEPGCKPNIVCRTYPRALSRSNQGSSRVLSVGADPSAKLAPAEPAQPAQPEEGAKDYF